MLCTPSAILRQGISSIATTGNFSQFDTVVQILSLFYHEYRKESIALPIYKSNSFHKSIVLPQDEKTEWLPCLISPSQSSPVAAVGTNCLAHKLICLVMRNYYSEFVPGKVVGSGKTRQQKNTLSSTGNPQKKGCRNSLSGCHTITACPYRTNHFARQLRHFSAKSCDQQFSAKYLMVRTI